MKSINSRSGSRIKHIVMWNLIGNTIDDKTRAAQIVKSRFEGLIGMIPGLSFLEIGIDISHVSYACDVVLYSEFESLEALNLYAIHPEHLRIRNELEGVRIARYQVDYVSE